MPRLSPANSSRESSREVMGQLVTPQKTHTMPSPAPKEGCSPSRGAAVQPKVAPVKNTGTISPPLKPAPRVMVVKSIFSRNASGRASPPMAAWITAVPAPL